jgi:hypothetical protein
MIQSIQSIVDVDDLIAVILHWAWCTVTRTGPVSALYEVVGGWEAAAERRAWFAAVPKTGQRGDAVGFAMLYPPTCYLLFPRKL